MNKASSIVLQPVRLCSRLSRPFDQIIMP